MQMMKPFLIALAAVAMAACGGGGGGGSPFGGDAGGGGGGGGGGTGSVVMSLSSTTVTAASPATVTARVLNSTGAGVPNVVVSFSSSNSLGAFSAPTALTNGDGVATVTLSPASSTTVGADTVVASATVSGSSVSGSIGFQLTATNVTIASFVSDTGSTALSAYGQAQLTVNLSGTAPGTPVNVSVSSACVSQGRATLTPASVSTSTGVATFTLRDGGCGAFNTNDSLQASVTGSSVTASLTVGLTAPAVASVAFVSAVPSEIFLRGSGFAENSNITFQVRDANGLGVPNQEVVLEATSLAGGLTLDGTAVPVTKRTDVNGNVIVRINSGTVPTPVRVRATLTSSGISTVSSSLAVAVGLPSQQNFSLSQRTLNIEGYDLDGTTNTYTVIASDRLGNPVPADTAINFVAEGGQVQAIRFTTIANGLSSATTNFQTSSPRPPDGRVTVLAYALGEESFLDASGDNVYTAGEDFQDLGDVFLDRLFNGTYNPLEDQFISLTTGGTAACVVATSPLLRINVGAPSRTITNAGVALATCTAGWGRAYVRKAVQTVFSTSSTRLGWRNLPDPLVRSAPGTTCAAPLQLIDRISSSPYAANDTPTRVPFYLLGTGAGVVLENAGTTGSFSFLVADSNPTALNPVAAGSTITATATTGLSVTALGTPVPSTLDPSGAAVTYNFEGTTASGTITITVRSPGGLASVFQVPIYRNALAGTSPCPPPP
jgi:hypothetical protein